MRKQKKGNESQPHSRKRTHAPLVWCGRAGASSRNSNTSSSPSAKETQPLHSLPHQCNLPPPRRHPRRRRALNPSTFLQAAGQAPSHRRPSPATAKGLAKNTPAATPSILSLPPQIDPPPRRRRARSVRARLDSVPPGEGAAGPNPWTSSPATYPEILQPRRRVAPPPYARQQPPQGRPPLLAFIWRPWWAYPRVRLRRRELHRRIHTCCCCSCHGGRVAQRNTSFVGCWWSTRQKRFKMRT